MMIKWLSKALLGLFLLFILLFKFGSANQVLAEPSLVVTPSQINRGGSVSLFVNDCSNPVTFFYRSATDSTSHAIDGEVRPFPNEEAPTGAVMTFQPPTAGSMTISARCGSTSIAPSTILVKNTEPEQAPEEAPQEPPAEPPNDQPPGNPPGSNTNPIPQCDPNTSKGLDLLKDNASSEKECPENTTCYKQVGSGFIENFKYQCYGKDKSPLCTPKPNSDPKNPDTSCSQSVGVTCPDGDGLQTAIGCVPTKPDKFIELVLKIAIGIGGVIALLFMILGAFKMITSAGSAEAVKAGQDQFTSAVIGLLFIIFSVLLLQFLGADILNIPGFIK